MRSFTLFLACSCAIMAVSCQKNKQNPPAEPPVTNHETVRVALKLTGDILLSESPLANARSFGDTTLYAVGVRRQDGTEPLYTGLFTHPDSVYIDVPSSGQYNVSVHIYKKGTGGGLFYDLEDGFRYFPYPIGTLLKNRMDSVVRFPYMLDQVAYTKVAASNSGDVIYPEVEYFQGDVDFIGSPYPAPIYINMKRRSFGVQFRATNFTEGELNVEFSRGPDALGGPVIADLKLTPANINSDYHILGSDDFRTSDSTQLVNIKLTLIRPDGSHTVIGTKNIYFKRNVLTKLQLTFPEYGRAGIGLAVGETDWSGTETIDF